MDNIGKFMMIVFCLGIIPFGLGLSLTNHKSRQGRSFWLNVILGYFGMFALFQLMCVPATFLKLRFSTLSIVYGVCVTIWFAASVCYHRRRLWSCSLGHLKQMGKMSFVLVLAVGLILLQAGVYVVGMALDADDTLYVATATTSLQTDGLFTHSCYTGLEQMKLPKRYVLSPFPVFLAFLSKVTGVMPAVMAHTVLPVFLVVLAYAVYGLWGRKLFKENTRAVGFFLLFLSLIHIWSYYSVYTQGTFMLIRIWQGKAVLAAILLPALLYFGGQYFQERQCDEITYRGLAALMISCCLVSSMGIMLAPIMLGILGLTVGVVSKNYRKLPAAFLCCVPSLLFALIYLLLP